MIRALSLFAFVAALCLTSAAQAEPKYKALIVDGQNNHGNWPTTSKMMKKYLEDTGLYTVDVATTAPKGSDENFKPEFNKYNVVISNYNGAEWPKSTQAAFVEFIRNGGGFVVIHAANNSFGNWKEYNEIIGLGGWGGRSEKSGPYVYFGEDGKQVRDTVAGRGGSHGAKHDFQVVVRDAEHPITKGLPPAWMHVSDELYDRLRGPADNMQVLATAFSAKEKGGTGRHEPMILTLTYGKGRVFHTPMGHGNDSQECVGYITVFQRGVEWATTGAVTIAVPADFPKPDQTSQRKFAP